MFFFFIFISIVPVDARPLARIHTNTTHFQKHTHTNTRKLVRGESNQNVNKMRTAVNKSKQHKKKRVTRNCQKTQSCHTNANSTTGGWSWTWNHGTWPNRWAPWQQQPPGGPAGSASGHRGGSGTSRGGGGGGPWGGSNSSQRAWHPSARQTATKYTRWGPASFHFIFSVYPYFLLVLFHILWYFII